MLRCQTRNILAAINSPASISDTYLNQCRFVAQINEKISTFIK